MSDTTEVVTPLDTVISSGNASELFTQAQVDGIVVDRLRRAEVSYEKKVREVLGMTPAEAVAKLASIDTLSAKLSDYDTLAEELNRLRAEQTEREYATAVDAAMKAFVLDGKVFNLNASEMVITALRSRGVPVDGVATALTDLAGRNDFLLKPLEPANGEGLSTGVITTFTTPKRPVTSGASAVQMGAERVVKNF